MKGNCQCHCKSGFKGEKCETKMKDKVQGGGCDIKNCVQKNTDHVKPGSCECVCKKGFEGDKCGKEVAIDCVLAEDCTKDNTDKVSGKKGNCQCHCKSGFKGKKCGKQMKDKVKGGNKGVESEVSEVAYQIGRNPLDGRVFILGTFLASAGLFGYICNRKHGSDENE